MAKAWPFGEWSPIVCQPIVSQIYQCWYQGNQCRCYWLGVVLPQASQVHSHNKVCARLFLVCLQLSMFRPASDPHILFRTYSIPPNFPNAWKKPVPWQPFQGLRGHSGPKDAHHLGSPMLPHKIVIRRWHIPVRTERQRTLSGKSTYLCRHFTFFVPL